MTPLNTIIEILKEKNGNETYYLDTPISIRFSDSDYDVVGIWGLCASPSNQLYVMDMAAEWYAVEEDERGNKIIQAIKERVEKIYSKVA